MSTRAIGLRASLSQWVSITHLSNKPRQQQFYRLSLCPTLSSRTKCHRLTTPHEISAYCRQLTHLQLRHASSSSSRWLARQSKDRFAREAKVVQLKSRAAFKLLEIDAKYKIFRPGLTVVDLGFAPGSWTQVAVSKTSPGGRVVGIDIIPAQPPPGASSLQGNFLSPAIREGLREFLADQNRGRVRERGIEDEDGGVGERGGDKVVEQGFEGGTKASPNETESGLEFHGPEKSSKEAQLHQEDEREGESTGRQANTNDVDDWVADSNSTEHRLTTQPPTSSPLSPSPRDAAELDTDLATSQIEPTGQKPKPQKQRNPTGVVHIVLSDMSAPWPLVNSTWVKSVSNPYHRMMNTSGNDFKDHVGSMGNLNGGEELRGSNRQQDLCHAALEFCFDNLVVGGMFVCKYYAGAEERAFETRLKQLFGVVHRLKPEASRQDSREKYFIALRRKKHAKREAVLSE